MQSKEENYHSLSIEEVIRKQKSDKNGLSIKEAKFRLERDGLNEIIEKKKFTHLLALLRQFKSLFVYILILAAVISYLIGHILDVYVIGVVLFINASIGFFQDYKAEKAVSALKKMVVTFTKVYRNGELQQINSKEIVVGDVILLEEGDKIPADARIIDSKNLKTNESSLTGESLPIDKTEKQLAEKTILADRRNMVYFGTFVASGTAKAIIVSTGKNTVIGKLALSIEKIKTRKYHFHEKTDKLAMQMGVIAFAGAFLTFLIGFFLRDLEFTEIFIFTISSLVSGIPEGLVAVLTITLSIGALRMSRRKAIIRNLPAIETLGVVSTIITDKTGTLTQNVMSIEKIALASGEEVQITGEGWIPKGEFTINHKKIIPLEKPNLKKLLHIASICNNSYLIKEEIQDKKEKREEYKIIGDPTEASLIVLAEKAGVKKETLKHSEKKIDDLPFDQELKYRASLSSLIGREGTKEIYLIGSPEAVLEKSNYYLLQNSKTIINQKFRDQTNKQIHSLTSQAYRVLALAYKEADPNKKRLEENDISNMVIVGIVAMKDPPRKGVKEAIEKAKKAGIRILMATGDHKNTAIAIAKEIGLVSKSLNPKNLALTEEELSKLNSKQFEKAIKEISIFARLTPSMKLRIASTLQNQGQIVAMTGDGVNDAPALKKADIGISMGLIGTDVARESSEVILANDNFSTIVSAIEEGRIVMDNTRKTSFFLVNTNLAEDVTIISTLILGMPLPLLPTQILWLNLVTDTGAGIGLAAEPGHHEVLNEKPKSSKSQILSKEILPFLFLMVGTMLLITMLSFRHFLPQGLEKARTAAFLIMAFTQIFNSFNMKSLKKSIFETGILNNKTLLYTTIISITMALLIVFIPVLSRIFHFSQLSILELLILFLVSSSVLIFGEGYKAYKNRKFSSKKNQLK